MNPHHAIDVSIRVTRGDKARLRDLAKTKPLSLSEFLRSLIDESLQRQFCPGLTPIAPRGRPKRLL